MSKIRIHTIQQLNQYTRDKVNRHFDERIDLDLSEKSDGHIIWDVAVGALYDDGIPYMKAYEWSWLMENPTADLLSTKDLILPGCGNILCCNPNHMKLFKDAKPFLAIYELKQTLGLS